MKIVVIGGSGLIGKKLEVSRTWWGTRTSTPQCDRLTRPTRAGAG